MFSLIILPGISKISSVESRVIEVTGTRQRRSTKSLDLDENFKPKHTLFCRELGFGAIYALFGVLWAKKVPFWVKNSVSWARSALLHGIYFFIFIYICLEY